MEGVKGDLSGILDVEGTSEGYKQGSRSPKRVTGDGSKSREVVTPGGREGTRGDRRSRIPRETKGPTRNRLSHTLVHLHSVWFCLCLGGFWGQVFRLPSCHVEWSTKGGTRSVGPRIGIQSTR